MAKKSRQAATPHLRIRIEPRLLARLEKSRNEHGRTLTGEIAQRVEESFRRAEDAGLTAEVFRAALGDRTGDLLRALATAIWLIEKATGKKWHQDRDTALQVKFAMDEVLDAFVFPLNAERAFRRFKWEDPHFRAKKDRMKDRSRAEFPSRYPEFVREHPNWAAEMQESDRVHEQQVSSSKAAALEALQKMGIAPSDAEIAEAAKKYAQANPKDDGEGK
jgi:hypothetical protein